MKMKTRLLTAVLGAALISFGATQAHARWVWSSNEED